MGHYNSEMVPPEPEPPMKNFAYRVERVERYEYTIYEVRPNGELMFVESSLNFTERDDAAEYAQGWIKELQSREED